MKDCRGKSRVSFKREWGNRHSAMRKIHRQRELSELNQRYRRECLDNPWVGKTLNEIQKQYREHDMSVQDKVKKLERLVSYQDDCETNDKLPNEALTAELQGLQLLDYKTHSGLKPFATKKMATIF